MATRKSDRKRLMKGGKPVRGEDDGVLLELKQTQESLEQTPTEQTTAHGATIPPSPVTPNAPKQDAKQTGLEDSDESENESEDKEDSEDDEIQVTKLNFKPQSAPVDEDSDEEEVEPDKPMNEIFHPNYKVKIFNVAPPKLDDNVKTIEAIIICPQVKFMDQHITHMHYLKGDKPLKISWLGEMGKALVKRVVKPYHPKSELAVLCPQIRGGVDNCNSPVFSYRKITEEKIKTLLHNTVIPVAIKYKKDHWRSSSETLPYIQNDTDVIKVEKLSHVLKGDDLMMVILHKTKHKAMAWANENENNIYSVWDKGKVPVDLIKQWGVKIDFLKPQDKANYDEKFGLKRKASPAEGEEEKKPERTKAEKEARKAKKAAHKAKKQAAKAANRSLTEQMDQSAANNGKPKA